MIGRASPATARSSSASFLDEIDANVPPDLDVHLVLDNSATHKTKLIRDWLAKRTRYHVHFTPTSASWINQVERWFALLTERTLRRGVHRSVADLERDIRLSSRATNAEPKPFRWVKIRRRHPGQRQALLPANGRRKPETASFAANFRIGTLVRLNNT